jgi:hypothetical protein
MEVRLKIVRNPRKRRPFRASRQHHDAPMRDKPRRCSIGPQGPRKRGIASGLDFIAATSGARSIASAKLERIESASGERVDRVT